MAKKSHLRAGKQNPEKFSLREAHSLPLPPSGMDNGRGVFTRLRVPLDFYPRGNSPSSVKQKKKKVVRSFYRENCNNRMNERKLYHRCREGIVYRAYGVGFSYEDTLNRIQEHGSIRSFAPDIP